MDVKEYQRRAQQCRELARHMGRDSSQQEAMEEIAKTWESLADWRLAHPRDGDAAKANDNGLC
jgi:hypothetical protein